MEAFPILLGKILNYFIEISFLKPTSELNQYTDLCMELSFNIFHELMMNNFLKQSWVAKLT